MLAALAACVSGATAGAYDDFFAAIRRDRAGEVVELLQRGFDPNSRDPAGQPALVLAITQEARKVVDVLLRAPGLRPEAANPLGESALMMAALRGELAWARELIALGAPVDSSGWTPLHYAASGTTSESLRVAELLLDRGANVDSRSPNGTTPLMMAARYGTEATVDLLLGRGADRSLRNERDLDAAEFARGAGRAALAARLTVAR